MSKVKIQGNASGTGTFTIQAPNSNSDRVLSLPDGAGEILVNGTTSNVGINTATTTGQLNVAKSGGNQINVIDSSGSSPGIRFANSSNTPLAFIEAPAGNGLSFFSSTTERMRIDSSGNLLVGGTSQVLSSKQLLNFDGFTQNALVVNDTTSNSSRGYAYFSIGGSLKGSITGSTTAVAYNTTSDYRLKTDVQPMTGATERLKALKPVNFEWISSGERVDGFIAHEAAEVVPEAVTGTKDAMRTEEYEVTPAEYEDVVIPAVLDSEGNEINPERTEQRLVTEAVMGEREVPDYQGIDQSKLVPLLVATIQELEARIAALEAV